MSSVNRVILMGRLGKDPILKSTSNGKPFCMMNLATDGWEKDENGNKKAEWHYVHVFGKQAEKAAEYLSKGRQVFIEGRIKTTDSFKNGNKIWRTWITAEKLTYMNDRKSFSEELTENGVNTTNEREALASFEEDSLS